MSAVPNELAKSCEHVVKGLGCGDADSLTMEARGGRLGFRHCYYLRAAVLVKVTCTSVEFPVTRSRAPQVDT
jgi:hypothetical protein